MSIVCEANDLLIESAKQTLLVFDESLLTAYQKRQAVPIWSSGNPVKLTWPVRLREVEEVKPFVVRTLRMEPQAVGWLLWAIAVPVGMDEKGKDESGQDLQGVGLVGFQGPPDRTDTVDIGYAVHPEYQNRGLATEAVGLLSAWAFSQGVSRITAEVYPSREASRRVLEKNAFQLVGRGTNLGTMRYARTALGHQS